METPEFQENIKDMVDNSLNTLFTKADGYTDPEADRLRNFKVAAELQHTTPVKALAGMMAKHTVKLYDLIDKSETEWTYWSDWGEVIGDSINYLLLLSALLQETDENGELVRNPKTEPEDPPLKELREKLKGETGSVTLGHLYEKYLENQDS